MRGQTLGFTLIELMMVVAIIGLLGAIVLPKFADLIDRSREAALKGQLGSLRSALSIYYEDNEGISPAYDGFNPLLYGMYHLNGKYIDLDQMTFHIPRYAQQNNFSNGSSHSARSLYHPSTGMVYKLLNYKSDWFEPVIPHHYSGGPFITYYCWMSSINGPAYHELQSFPLESGLRLYQAAM